MSRWRGPVFFSPLSKDFFPFMICCCSFKCIRISKERVYNQVSRMFLEGFRTFLAVFGVFSRGFPNGQGFRSIYSGVFKWFSGFAQNLSCKSDVFFCGFATGTGPKRMNYCSILFSMHARNIQGGQHGRSLRNAARSRISTEKKMCFFFLL